jgi:hypothetical protein
MNGDGSALTPDHAIHVTPSGKKFRDYRPWVNRDEAGFTTKQNAHMKWAFCY